MPQTAAETDMEKVKKFPLAEFLGFIISAKKCVILDMSKAIEIGKIVVNIQNCTLETYSINHWASSSHIALRFHHNQCGMNL